ncbi:hypothetical protein EXIGLDRAFT_744993 [Exidia glandulosa HHB12029]|uniref:Uncharacterized protein n=1 Tax=Exidia glandulosa HHB12029 TaxID=1314781 RepID=A0A165P5F1_EXIGL|nr:hypothetical protein EXIGLDRAFT_744993 [Exidia glandulosa HHB12029]
MLCLAPAALQRLSGCSGLSLDAVTQTLAPRIRKVHEGRHTQKNADVGLHVGVGPQDTSSSGKPPPQLHPGRQVQANQTVMIVPHVPILRPVQSLSTQTKAPTPVLVERNGPQAGAVSADGACSFFIPHRILPSTPTVTQPGPAGPPYVGEPCAAMADLDTAEVVAATRAVLQTESKDMSVWDLTLRELRELVEQELGVERGSLKKQPFRGTVKVAAVESFDGLRAKFGLRGFKGDLGQCDACGSWVKLPNLAAHAEKRCKALEKKEDGRYWAYVAEDGDSGDSGDFGDGEGENDV